MKLFGFQIQQSVLRKRESGGIIRFVNEELLRQQYNDYLTGRQVNEELKQHPSIVTMIEGEFLKELNKKYE